jgi:hypothetical protein
MIKLPGANGLGSTAARAGSEGKKPVTVAKRISAALVLLITVPLHKRVESPHLQRKPRAVARPNVLSKLYLDFYGLVHQSHENHRKPDQGCGH